MTRRRRIVTICLSLSLLLGSLLPLAQTAGARPCEALQLYDEAAASEILRTQRPFVPGNRDLFGSYELEDWADIAPIQSAKGPAPTEEETYQDLRLFLERRFPCSPERVAEGLAFYTNPLARQKAPAPNLRAALAALTGTVGELAIYYLLYFSPVHSIHFGVVIHLHDGWPPGNPATVYHEIDGTISIVFDGIYRFNPFGTLSALLFHESLHVELLPTESQQGIPDGVGMPEEATAVALEAIVYMQMLLADPTIAKNPDAQTRFGGNYLALLRLNSGVLGTDQLNLFVPGSEVDIDPTDADPLTEFYEFYATTYDDSDKAEWRERETYGNLALAWALPALAEPGALIPAEPNFDRATLDYLDQNLAILSPGQLIAVACILELDVPCP